MLYSVIATYLPPVFIWILVLINIVVAARVILQTQSSTKTVAYLMLLFFLPGIGILIYFTFGVNVRKNKLYKDKQSKNKKLRELIKEWTVRETTENQQDYSSIIGDKQDLVTLLLQDSFSPLTDSNKVSLLINGENKFPLQRQVTLVP